MIWLTREIYRLTLLFPKKEPLRYKIRELADEILDNSMRIIYPLQNQAFFNGISSGKYAKADFREVKNRSPELSEDLEVLDSLFEVAKEQNWINVSDILAIQKEYANLREELERIKIEDSLSEVQIPPLIPVAVPVAVQEELRVTAIPLSEEKINERQGKIMTFLREQGRAQVWQLKEILPEVTKRTLRRDFENLLKKGLIERIGERNNTFYQIKVVQV